MADSKIEDLVELTTVADADVLAIVDDPGGSPATKKITKANLVGTGGLTFAKVVKASDEVICNTSTLQDDDELLFTPTINKTYGFILMLFGDSNTTADLKIAFSLPTGATGDWNAGTIWRTDVGVASADLTVAEFIPHVTGEGVIPVFGRIIMSSTAGNAVLQWAQQAATAVDTKILKGSYLVVWEE